MANALVSFACAMQVQTFRKVNGYAFASTMCIGNMRSGMDSLCSWVLNRNPAALKNPFIIGASSSCLRWARAWAAWRWISAAQRPSGSPACCWPSASA